jgi:hypothetical protein
MSNRSKKTITRSGYGGSPLNLNYGRYPSDIGTPYPPTAVTPHSSFINDNGVIYSHTYGARNFIPVSEALMDTRFQRTQDEINAVPKRMLNGGKSKSKKPIKSTKKTSKKTSKKTIKSAKK